MWRSEGCGCMWRSFRRQQGADRKRGAIGLYRGGPLGRGEERAGVMFLVADEVVSMIGEMCVM